MDSTDRPAPEMRLAILRLAREAAEVDGRLDERDRRRLAAWPSLRGETTEAVEATEALRRRLRDDGLGALAFDTALGACSADGLRSSAETRHLADLGGALGVSVPRMASAAAIADALVTMPLSASTAPEAAPAEGEDAILRSAEACGALAWTENPLAALAVIVLQTRLLHRVAAGHGIAPDVARVRDRLLACRGLVSQYLDLVSASPAPDTEGGASAQASAARLAYAHAFAVGTLALRDGRHDGGIESPHVRYAALVDEGSVRFDRHATAIERMARVIDPMRLPAFVRAH